MSLIALKKLPLKDVSANLDSRFVTELQGLFFLFFRAEHDLSLDC
jgi:hypothetical protein